MSNFRTLQSSNKRKTFFLLIAFAFLMWLVAFAAVSYFGGGGAAIVPIAVGFSLLTTWWSYYSSDKLVIRMTGAQVLQESDNPKLFGLVQEVCLASGLPMPKVAVVIDDAPNAFATGRNPEHALIAFTTGILDVMDRDELQGVVAHEMAHVANRDTLVSAVAATTAGAIAIVSDMLLRMMWFGGRRDQGGNSNPITLVISLVVMLMAPIAAILLKSAISRRRESLADATAVDFTRNPAGLRKALEKHDLSKV
ncbi:MAG: hypothetical protein EBX92_06895 [Actinobacteria bacterium]|nr:hypothetical protein [Actinomycetota bacterium]